MSLRILFHHPRLLHPLNGGDRIRTYHMLRELRRQHHVTCLTLRTPADGPEVVERASEYCQELITVPHPVKNQRTLGFYVAVLGNTLFGRYPFLAQKYRSRQAIEQLQKLLTPPGRFDLLICDYLAPMANLIDRDMTSPVINLIDDPIAPLTDAIAIIVARQLLRAMRTRVCCQSRDLRNDASSVGLGPYRLKFFASRGLDRKLI